MLDYCSIFIHGKLKYLNIDSNILTSHERLFNKQVFAKLQNLP